MDAQISVCPYCIIIGREEIANKISLSLVRWGAGT